MVRLIKIGLGPFVPFCRGGCQSATVVDPELVRKPKPPPFKGDVPHESTEALVWPHEAFGSP